MATPDDQCDKTTSASVVRTMYVYIVHSYNNAPPAHSPIITHNSNFHYSKLQQKSVGMMEFHQSQYLFDTLLLLAIGFGCNCVVMVMCYGHAFDSQCFCCLSVWPSIHCRFLWQLTKRWLILRANKIMRCIKGLTRSCLTNNRNELSDCHWRK